jgi:hypothetical protein
MPCTCAVLLSLTCPALQYFLHQLMNMFFRENVIFFPMPLHVPYGLRGLPSRLWPKCKRLLKLGRPWGAVTLSPWGGWWYMEYEVPGGGLNLSSTKLPRPWSPWEYTLLRKNPQCRTGNQTRDLIISSQKLWPLDHEAGRFGKMLFYIKCVLWFSLQI